MSKKDWLGWGFAAVFAALLVSIIGDWIREYNEEKGRGR